MKPADIWVSKMLQVFCEQDRSKTGERMHSIFEAICDETRKKCVKAWKAKDGNRRCYDCCGENWDAIVERAILNAGKE
ncbi:hypothetical protein ES705_16432 [subsurface metagenome]